MPQDFASDIEQPYDPGSRRSVSPVDWFGPVQEFPARTSTAVKPLVCGEIAFGEVARALRAARHSINMCFWGLDPAMLLERGTAENWNIDAILGEILLRKAAEGVQVRVVVWDTYGSGIGSGGSGASDPTSDTQGGNSANLAKFREFCMTRENIEVKMTNSLGAGSKFPSFHQKSIVVDIENPAGCNAFVMGHNMLVAYWSTKDLLRTNPRKQFYLQIAGFGTPEIENEQVARKLYIQSSAHPSAYGFPVGPSAHLRERLDEAIASAAAAGGPNFRYTAHEAQHLVPFFDVSSQVWGKAVVDIYANFARVWKLNNGTIAPDPASLSADDYVDRRWAAPVQVAATFPKASPPARGIEQIYRRAMQNADRYILMVNQYFRNWPLSDEIIKWWATNRQIPTKKQVPLFVVTNDFDGKFMEGGHDGTTYDKFANAGIPISMGKMLTGQAGPHTEIYVHAKLLIVDDVLYSIGSANYNQRSLGTDPELNVGVVHGPEALSLRREVMNILVGDPMEGLSHGKDSMRAFERWQGYLNLNTERAANTGAALPHGRVVHYDPVRAEDNFWNRIGNGIVMAPPPDSPLPPGRSERDA